MNYLRRDEDGQIAIMMVMVFPVVFIIFGLAFDAGLAFTDHRIAQNQVDAAALAGTLTLPDWDSTQATADVERWLAKNGAEPEDHSCLEYLDLQPAAAPDNRFDTLRVCVRRQTPSTFFQLVGIPFIWVSASATATVFGQEGEGPEYADCLTAGEICAPFIFIDEDSIGPGIHYWPAGDPPDTTVGIPFTGPEVNGPIQAEGLRAELPFFRDNIGTTIHLQTGEFADEGFFAPKYIPTAWTHTGPTDDGMCNYLAVCVGYPTPGIPGPGLGSGANPVVLLDKIPVVFPLTEFGIAALVGKTYCGVVFNSDVSINYDGPPLWTNANLQGANLGIVAFEIIDMTAPPSPGKLPTVQVTIRDANDICGGLYSNDVRGAALTK